MSASLSQSGRQRVKQNQKSERRARPAIQWLMAGLFGLALLCTLGPLVGRLGDYWPGFFYAPFFTTDVFNDPSTPTGRAGLHPEDRVIGINRERIERLNETVWRAGEQGQRITLLYELGRELTPLSVPVERLKWWRGLEKYGPLLAVALALGWWGWQRQVGWAWAMGMALVAAADYWLNPGAGRRSGFDPAAWLELGRWTEITAKWSTYLYWPLWTLALGWLAWEMTSQMTTGRALRFGRGLLAATVVTEWASYAYDGWKSQHYVNPDYIVWHARAVFWPAWVILGGLALALAWRRHNFWPGLGLLVLAVGWAYPTTFDTAWPGPGPQWYVAALGLVVYGLARPAIKSRSSDH